MYTLTKVDLIKLARRINPKMGLVEAKQATDLWLSIIGQNDIEDVANLARYVRLISALTNGIVYLENGQIVPRKPDPLTTDEIYTLTN